MALEATHIAPPSLALAVTELLRATAELSSLPWAAPILRRAPRGDGHPVVVLPGFTASDGSTVLLRRYLRDLGYDVYGWELGRNLDHHSIGPGGERLAKRIDTVRAATGCKVSLIGWSLGGVMAREVAKKDPESVRQVISLGSPFTGNPRATNVWHFFEWLTGQKLDTPEMARRLEEACNPPPVPTTAIYSKTDGITAWQNCLERKSERTDNIEVHGSHCGLVVNPAVLYAIADRLALPDEEWKPFDRRGWRAAFYPSSGHLH